MAFGAILYTKNISQRDKDPIVKAKDIVRTIAKDLELGKVVFESTALSQFHPKKQANVKIGDLIVGFIGALHPIILQNNKIGETSGVVYLSLNITQIIDTAKEKAEHIYSYETLQDQIIWRDICFVVDANKSFDGVISAVKNVPEVKEVEVFDVYAGKNL